MRRTIPLAVCVCMAVSQFASPARTGAAQPPKVTATLLHNLSAGLSFWWSPDNKTLATLGPSGLQLYDAATGTVRAEIKPENSPPATASASKLFFTPDGRSLVVQSDRVRVFDAADGKLLRAFAYGTAPANAHDRVHKPVEQDAVSYDPNAPTYPGEKTIVYPSDEAELEELPTAYLSDRVISPDGKRILVRAKEAGKAQVYDLGTGELKFTLEPLADTGLKKGRAGYGDALGEYSPDGRLIVTTHRNNTPRLWDAATGALVADLGPHSAAVYGARFSADGRFVATTSFDGLVKIWDAATGKLRHTVGSTAKNQRTYFAQWNPADGTFAVKTRAWEIQIWNAETGRLVSKLDQKAADEKFDKNLTFVYSPDGKILLTKARNNGNRISPLTLLTSLKGKHKMIAHLWDAATGALVASVRDTDKFDYEAYANDKFFWSPSGEYLVTAGPTVKIWNRRGELLHRLEENGLFNASLSPDGRLLVVTKVKPHGLLREIAEVSKILVGKLPNFDWKTNVWKIEDNRP